MSSYKIKFQPSTAKRRLNRYGQLIHETDENLYFKELNADGSNKMNVKSRNCIPRQSFICLMRSEAELEPLHQHI